MITQEQLKQEVRYEDGHFYRLSDGEQVTESPITDHHRYLRVRVCGKVYALHRMVFLWQNGYLPKIVDHIDNDRSNNKIENLREATQQQNCLNRVAHKNNRSGYKNVFWDSKSNKWCVLVNVFGKRKTIGRFEDLELAELVAYEARVKFHGEFARH